MDAHLQDQELRPSEPERVRVAAIVANSVKHDARVVKEAESLRDAGYDVLVIGMKDNDNTEDSFTTQCGIFVRLMPWRALAYGAFARLVLLGLPVVIAAYLLALRALGSMDAIVETVAPLLIAYVWLRFYSRQSRVARRYAELEYPDAVTGRPPSRLRRLVRFPSLKPVLAYFQRRGAARVRNRQFLRALEAARPAVVHCHDAQTLAAGVSYKRRHGGKVVFDSHEYFEEISLASAGQRRRLRRIVKRRAYQVDGFVTVNESIARAISDRYPHLPEPVVVMNATRAPDSEVVYDGRLHEAARLLPETSILLYQGGLAGGRGLDELIRAAPLLPRSWHLVIMGWGGLQSRLVGLATDFDPSGSRISFLPRVAQEELILWTAGATVGVIPYEKVSMNNWFCSPNKLWEYPRSGVPLLVSPFPEMKAIVERHRIGWLLEENVTARDIAAKVTALRSSDLEAAKKACRRFILQDNWRVYEERLVALYDGLVPRLKENRPA